MPKLFGSFIFLSYLCSISSPKPLYNAQIGGRFIFIAYGNIIPQTIQLIVVLTRNAYCHHARVWNKENAIPPTEPRKIIKPWLISSVPNKRFFFNLCILKYFINIIDNENNMIQKLEGLLGDYPNVDIAPMGFPTNWQNEPVWQNVRD